jgi:hypothetical protein
MANRKRQSQEIVHLKGQSLKNVIEQLETLSILYGEDAILIYDDPFNINEGVYRVARYVEENKEETAARLRRAGFLG